MAEQLGEIGRNGGWRAHPNSIAALFRHQILAQDQRKCARCRHIALRGEPYCRAHTVGSRSTQSPAEGRGESRLLQRLERLGLLPLDLIALPVWRGLNGLPTKTRAPARLALVQAWDKRDNEPLHWAKVQRTALDLGAAPGKLQNVASWRANS